MVKQNWWKDTSAADDGDLDDDDEPASWLDDFDFDEYADEEDDDYVGGLWGRYGGGSSRADEAARLASAQRLVQGFVDTFATGDRPYTVTFDESVVTAGTDYKNRSVVISHKPLFDQTISDAEANTILTAMAVHEASHVRYGRPTHNAVVKEFGEYNRRALRLSNVIDDVRIERRFVRDYPGYRDVFDPAIDYVAQGQLKGAGLESLDPTTVSPLDAAMAIVRYPRYVAEVDAYAEARDWWTDWAERATRDDKPATHVAAIHEALARLEDEQDEREKEPPGPVCGPTGPGGDDGEPKGQSTGSNDQDGETPKPASGNGDPDPSPLTECIGSSIDGVAESHGLDAHLENYEAQNLVEQGKALTDPLSDGNRGEIYWRPGGIAKKRVPVRASGAATNAIRAAFARSRTGRFATERNHKSGRIDNRSLARCAGNDFRLFSRKKAPSTGKYLVWLLIDCSGSMGGMEIIDATSVSAALAAASRSIPNIRLDIWGWTTGFRLGASFGAVRVWTTGDPIANVGYLQTVPMGGTPDSWVLEWAGKAIREAARPDETPVILIASDGQGYMRDSAVVAPIRKSGVHVASIAIGRGVDQYLTAVYGEKGVIGWAGSIIATARPLGRLLARIATGQAA